MPANALTEEELAHVALISSIVYSREDAELFRRAVAELREGRERIATMTAIIEAAGQDGWRVLANAAERVKQLEADNAALRAQVAGMAERIAERGNGGQ